MISSSSLMSSNTYSYSFNCQVQVSIYAWFDKRTDNIEWIRASSLGIYGASGLVTLVTRICGAVEIPFTGIKNLIISPGAGIESLKIGLTNIFIETPKQVLRIVWFPIEFSIESIRVLCSPRYFIISMLEHMKVLQIHSKTNTIYSEKYEVDRYEAYNKISDRDHWYYEKWIKKIIWYAKVQI